MGDVERQYEYKPKWWVILLFVGFFGLGAVLFAREATSNDPKKLPAFFCWILFAGAIWFIGRAGGWAVARLMFRHRVAFTRSALLLPKGLWSSEEVAIEYRDITRLSSSLLSARQLVVTHTGGKRLIGSWLLPSESAFDEVRQLLTDRVSTARQPGG
jgi:hypothetical protein